MIPLIQNRKLRIFLTDVVLWITAMLFYVVIRFYDPLENVAGFDTEHHRLFEFPLMLQFGLEAGIILGIVYGTVDIILDQHWLRKRSYGSVLLIKSGIHLSIILALSFWIRVEAFQRMDIEITSASMQSAMVNPGVLIALLYTTFISFLLNFTRQITLKFGPGNLTKFITGRFHQPREEYRIFMFIDMKDSTTHAELLGHVKFAELVQDCFSDLTVVEKYRAEVYQYVGDEAVLYWDVEKGLESLNCVMAFFAYAAELKRRNNYYQGKYGLTPAFKAGAHLGLVTVTEIGDIKRDLAFLGDTMNTAARIQGLCNQFGQNLLISENLLSRLPKSSKIHSNEIGQLTLKGKKEPIGVFAVELTEAYSAFTRK